MLKYVVNICLITFFVVHLVNADAVKQNRRTKRLGTGGRNATNKFKKEIWKQDVGDLFQIAPSTQGIQNVHLKCGSNSMFVKLETDSDFMGVMYAKGSFYDQANSPCFVQSKKNRGIRNLSMRFTFDQCNTKHEGNVFTNTIIVQNDPELVTPGDAAFALQCDFRKPRGLNVEANYETNNDRVASGARIILTSPDPTSDNAPPDTEHENTNFSETDTDTVTFTAHDKQTASNDAPSSDSTNPVDTDESASSSVESHPQKVKITIDSVPPYASDIETESTNHIDIEESERDSIEHAHDLNKEMSKEEREEAGDGEEKHVKNDEL